METTKLVLGEEHPSTLRSINAPDGWPSTKGASTSRGQVNSDYSGPPWSAMSGPMDGDIVNGVGPVESVRKMGKDTYRVFCNISEGRPVYECSLSSELGAKNLPYHMSRRMRSDICFHARSSMSDLDIESA